MKFQQGIERQNANVFKFPAVGLVLLEIDNLYEVDLVSERDAVLVMRIRQNATLKLFRVRRGILATKDV